MDNKGNLDRKEFFREGPLSLIRAFMQGAQDPSDRDRKDFPEPPLIRPPGALPEPDFLALCEGGGACAKSCPAEAIRMIPREGDAGRLVPVVRPSDSPCVVCDDLSCMKVCPSGALRLVPREQIRMGRARLNLGECLAWSGFDEMCRYCVDRCPMGAQALRMGEEDGRRAPIVGAGCVGCGVCEYHCPVYPAAIWIEERSSA